jgi:CheY-like chemotaxis protein
MRVLLVDDDPSGVELRRLVLEHAGHQVLIAVDAGAARAAFREATFDTVLLDLRLPDLEDGLALLRDFRQASREVRIVVLSGYAGDLDGRAERACADAILGKPVRTEQLLDALTSVRPVSL